MSLCFSCRFDYPNQKCATCHRLYCPHHYVHLYYYGCQFSGKRQCHICYAVNGPTFCDVAKCACIQSPPLKGESVDLIKRKMRRDRRKSEYLTRN